MTVALSDVVGAEILKALGWEPKRVTKLSLEMEHGEPVTVHVARILDYDETGAICRVLEQYELRPKPREDSEHDASA